MFIIKYLHKNKEKLMVVNLQNSFLIISNKLSLSFKDFPLSIFLRSKVEILRLVENMTHFI